MKSVKTGGAGGDLRSTQFPLESGFLLIVSLYLILGNLPRVVSLSEFRNDVLVSELIVYLAAISYSLLRPRALAFALHRFLPIYVIVGVSFIYGAFLNGFEVVPALFAIRLIAFFFAGGIAGFVLYNKFSKCVSKALTYFIIVYLFAALLSFAVYILFPNSIELWNYLAKFGIEFDGDPHQRRLVSVYLDPNYYSAIAVLPFVIGLATFRRTGSYWYLVFCAIILLSIILTVSRSGIATLCVMLALIIFQSIWRFLSRPRVRAGLLIFIPVLTLAFVSASPLYVASLSRIWERTIQIGEDPSARARLETFKLGFDVFAEKPILGVGYNYLATYTLEFKDLTSVDSSTLAILSNFGILLSSVLAALFVGWAHRILLRFYRARDTYPFFFNFFLLFLLYICLAVIFTSQFNNLLFYQFWLLPTVMLATYLSKVSRDVVYG